MLTLNLLNQFTRHFLKWTVCLLWLAPCVDDPSVTFIWMIFTFKIGKYLCLIVIMNGPLLFYKYIYSCLDLWLLIFQPLMFEGCECIPGTKYFPVEIFLTLQKFKCILGCINTIGNVFYNNVPLFRRSCCTWNKQTHTQTYIYLPKWAQLLIIITKGSLNGHGRCWAVKIWCSREIFLEVDYLTLLIFHWNKPSLLLHAAFCQ